MQVCCKIQLLIRFSVSLQHSQSHFVVYQTPYIFLQELIGPDW